MTNDEGVFKNTIWLPNLEVEHKEHRIVYLEPLN